MTDTNPSINHADSTEERVGHLIRSHERAVTDLDEKARQAEEQRELITGHILVQLPVLATVQLEAVLMFIEDGCEPSETNEGLQRQLNKAQAELSTLRGRNIELQKQVEQYQGNKPTLSFKNESERDKAKGILDNFYNGGGDLIDPADVKNLLEVPDPTTTGTMPTKPPDEPDPSPTPKRGTRFSDRIGNAWKTVTGQQPQKTDK